MIRFGRYCSECGTTLPLSSPAILVASLGAFTITLGAFLYGTEFEGHPPDWFWWLFGSVAMLCFLVWRVIVMRERGKDWSKECPRCQFMRAAMRAKGGRPSE